ncbi:MAG: NYN domain-containing protein [Anaerolineaceae bacterium]|nr:NYN domain-containing protein [Anaerolineaceae bacterium]
MPYLIDGHNLIPKIPGLQLNQLDDEQSLFILLDKYFKRIRKKAVVYFDHASLSSHSGFHTAYLQARFIRLPSSADEAILLRLKELGGDAHNYTIVTSDHWIVDNAQAVGASVISSDDFAHKLLTKSSKAHNKSNNSSEDVNYWLDIFQKKP